MSSSSSNPNVSFLHLFDVALREYRQKTGNDIAALADPLTIRLERCDSPDAVLRIFEEQAHAFNQFRNGDWKIRLSRRLKPIVNILFGLSTSGVFGQGISLTLPPSQAIFAGVGLLLAAAKGVSSSYDALIELFECFEHFLGRLEVLTEIPLAMGEILVKIMAELLNVLALATQQIRQGRFKKYAKMLIGDNDIEAVLQRLERLTTEELQMTAAQTLEVVYGLVNNMKVVMDDGKASINNIREALVAMQRISDNLNKMKCDKLREKVQKWLSPPNPSINHNTACDAHHDETAKWFLEGPLYDEWKATGSLLWAHGNPGSGKSVLCSSIIKDIESMRATGLVSVAYYYFDYNDPGKQDRRGFLSSLLTQLCTRSRRGDDILASLYEAHGNGSRQAREVDLVQCLKNVLTLPRHGAVYIIVDAVDESPNRPGIPSPREKVLQLMKELVGLRHPDTSTRVCITSRLEVDIQRVLEPLASHTVSLHEEPGQRVDIINYIESVVRSDENMRTWRPEVRQLVIDSLSQNVNGMFRWVFCQLDALRRCFPEGIQDALNELPMDLDETYKRILLGIDREKREHAIRLLKCLAFSHRPLRVEELAEVLAIQFGAAIPRLNTSLRTADAHDAVLLACSALVNIVKSDDYDGNDKYGYDFSYDYDDENVSYENRNSHVVQFSHYSVKEFLVSERLAKSDNENLSRYHISPEPAHTILAQSCISTLLQPDIHVGHVTDSFPLAKYAAQNWFHHVQCGGVTSQIQDGMERLFDPDREHFPMWISIHDIDNRWTWGPSKRTKASPLYYAALCGIGSLVEFLVTSRQQDPNKSHGGQGTPLHVAVRSGNIDIARFLLGHGANVNALDHQGDSPLHKALHNIDLTEFPVDIAADVATWHNQYFVSPSRAMQQETYATAQLLLRHGANVNARDCRHKTPLHLASLGGSLDVSRLLIEQGAVIDAPDGIGQTPFSIALENGHRKLAQFLSNDRVPEHDA